MIETEKALQKVKKFAMSSERATVEKFINIWERYYKLVVQVKPWQKIFSQSDEERLLKVIGRIPALSAESME